MFLVTDEEELIMMAPEIRALEKALVVKLEGRQLTSRLRRLNAIPPGHIDFSSNSYLSLSNEQTLQRELLVFIDNYKSSESGARQLFGSGGSRLLDGNTPLAESLEIQLANFHKAPAGLLFNSGYDANTGLFSCLPQPGDIIVYDELIHASVHDGMRLSRAGHKLPFKHNCLDSLKSLLQDLAKGEYGDGVCTGDTSVFLAVEGVYSMDGDVAKLADIVSAVERLLPLGNGYIIVDEAHSTGLFGENGRGLVCHLGLEDRVFARLHTFGKALGSSGAIVLTTSVTREYLVNYARPLIYSTALPLLNLATIKITYDFLASGGAEASRTHLRDLTMYAHDLLTSVCSRPRIPARLLSVRTGDPQSPIIPLFTSFPRSLAKSCQDRGFVVRAVVAPTVPKGSERIRICVHTRNNRDEVKRLVEVIGNWGDDHLQSSDRREMSKI